jgi:phenylpyruvate tautomerase PptA (4-oxalocrotonate tautomerase family)
MKGGDLSMPYINTKTNVEISKGKEESIKQKLGKAISLIPGKSEEWLMVSIEDQCSLYFKGKTDTPIAFVEVKLYGSSSAGAYQKLTAQITNILGEELGIVPSQVYVTYQEIEHWGYNGSMF